jgi:hypothetical protein
MTTSTMVTCASLDRQRDRRPGGPTTFGLAGADTEQAPEQL